VVLQIDPSLAQLKVGMDEHATLNVFKRQQNVIDGTSCHPLTFPTLNDLLQEIIYFKVYSISYSII
jgi:hypothetical protein